MRPAYSLWSAVSLRPWHETGNATLVAQKQTSRRAVATRRTMRRLSRRSKRLGEPWLRDGQCDACRTEANVSESRGYATGNATLVAQKQTSRRAVATRRTMRRLLRRSKRLGEPWLLEHGSMAKNHSVSAAIRLRLCPIMSRRHHQTS